MAYKTHDWEQMDTVKRIGQHMRKAGPITNRTVSTPSGAPLRTYKSAGVANKLGQNASTTNITGAPKPAKSKIGVSGTPGSSGPIYNYGPHVNDPVKSKTKTKNPITEFYLTDDMKKEMKKDAYRMKQKYAKNPPKKFY